MRLTRGRKIFAVAGTAVLAVAGLAACSKDSDTTTSPSGSTSTIKVGMAYDIGGRGDKSFNDMAAAGLDKAKADGTIADSKELEPSSPNETVNDKYERLKALCEAGYNPVIAVGFVYASGASATDNPLANAAKDCPDTKFAIVDDSSVDLPNVTGLVFAAEQGSFLVGAAAALKSTAGHIGFIGGCDVPLIHTFQAGYIAGAKAVNPSITIDSNYLSTGADACSGFNDPAKGKTTAEGMYDAGADIVYHAAGGSGSGVFQAALEKGKKAIGVDSDQYNTVDPSLQGVILTSMMKRVDTAVYSFIVDASKGTTTPGAETFDLKVDGVGYATSGGGVDDIKDQLEAYKAKIISGEIVVPTDVS